MNEPICSASLSEPGCPDCGAVDCDRAISSVHKCTSGFMPGGRRVCDRCGRLSCTNPSREQMGLDAIQRGDYLRYRAKDERHAID